MTETSELIKEQILVHGDYSRVAFVPEGCNSYSFTVYNNLLKRNEFHKAIYYSDDEPYLTLKEPQILVGVTSNLAATNNIVRIYDIYSITVEESEYVVIIMEHIDGLNLLNFMHTNEISVALAIRITKGILTGLAHLHNNRILHRDIKPSNIIMQDTIPKIADFGSAQILPEGCLSATASQHSSLYVPPEGWNQPSEYSYSSDIYQVGMILYQLVNGPLNTYYEDYLTPYVRRQLKIPDKDLSKLHPADQSSVINKGIEILARKGTLLKTGRLPRLYYNRQLKKIVKRATNPNYLSRYGRAPDFYQALNNLNTADWVQLDENEYSVSDLNNTDYKIVLDDKQKKAIAVLEVLKRQTGKSRFIRINERDKQQIVDPFKWIDDKLK